MKTTDASALRLLCLGDAKIISDRGALDPSRSVTFATALYLLLERKKKTSRKRLQELLWPGVKPDVAAHRLRQTLFKLRRLGISVGTDGKSAVLIEADVVSDIEEFEGTNGTSPAIETVSRPVIWPFEPNLSRDYDEWLDYQRQQLAARVVRVILSHVGTLRSAGKWDLIETWSRALLQHAPDNEEGALALAESLAMRGEKIQGVRVLDTYLAEAGRASVELRIPATAMRRRIVDKMPPNATSILAETPLIGREESLAELVRLLTIARTGLTQSCVIVGQPGIGKSRLVGEFLAFAALQGVTCHRVFCRSSDAKRSLSILLELVPILRGMRGSIGSSPETLAFLEGLTTHRPDDRRRPNALGTWDAVHSKLDTALGDIIDAVTEECPVVIVFEDCQWIDPGSAAVLERLLPKLGNHQLLVLFTTRSLEGNQIAEVLGRVSRIPLPPLTSSAASEIVLAIARQRGKEVSADYLAWCTAVAEGNPFFLHELANHWVETGDEHGAPASLTAVLKRRLARLSPHALQLLQTCSVLENCSTLDTMESVLGYPPHELLRSLNELSNAGMVAMTKSDGHSLTSDRVNSRHDLLSDTALAQLGTPARAYLHRRAASVLESRISKQGDASTLWSCAKHWQLAGDYPQAFRLTHSCATHLLEAELPSEAAEAFKKAIEYCATDSDRFTTLEGQAIASYQSSDWLHVMEIVPQARRLKDRLFPEQGHHDDLELMLRRAEWQTMNWEHILSDSLDCLDAEEAAPRHRIEAGVMGLMLLTLRGDGETGSAVFSRMISLAARSADIGDDLILQAEMIFNTWWGSVRNAVRAATKLVAAQREQHNLGALLRSLCNAGITLRVAGKFGAAADHLHEALVLADKHRIHRSKAQAIPMLAHMAIEQGKIADARKWLHELKQLPMTDEDRIVTADICAIDTRLALLDGRYAVARHLVEHELGHMRTDPLPHKRAYWNALRVAADLANDGRASTEALVKLHAEHLQTRGHPFQAFAAFALYTGLVSVGDKLRAERLLNEYLTKHRRERWKAPQHLLDSLTSLITKDRRHLRPRRLVTQ